MKKPNTGTVVVASLVASVIGTIILYLCSEKEHVKEMKEVEKLRKANNETLTEICKIAEHGCDISAIGCVNTDKQIGILQQDFKEIYKLAENNILLKYVMKEE